MIHDKMEEDDEGDDGEEIPAPGAKAGAGPDRGAQQAPQRGAASRALTSVFAVCAVFQLAGAGFMMLLF